MLEKGSNDPHKLIKFAKDIQQNIQRVTQIIESIKTFTETSKETESSCLLSEIIENASGLCSEYTNFHKIKIHFDFVQKPIYVKCCPERLSLAISKCISNSIEAIENQPDPWIKIGLRLSRDAAVISIQDSGPGVPVSLEFKIMEPFFSTKNKANSPGLGLSHTKKVVADLGGKFYLDPNNRHTCFIMELPIEAQEDKRIAI